MINIWGNEMNIRETKEILNLFYSKQTWCLFWILRKQDISWNDGQASYQMRYMLKIKVSFHDLLKMKTKTTSPRSKNMNKIYVILENMQG